MGNQTTQNQPVRTACRGTECDDHFLWVTCIKRDGKKGRVPLDELPVGVDDRLDREQIKGKFVFIDTATVRAAVAGDEGPFFQSHFHTCPNADEFRGGK